MSHNVLRKLSLVILLLSAFGVQNARAEAGDVAKGEKIYAGKCKVCHALDANKVGPMSNGSYGRKAGSLEGYAYSAGLKALGVTWDDASLDQWLTNPSAMAKGTKMSFRLNEAKDRADVIAYLKTLSASPKK